MSIVGKKVEKKPKVKPEDYVHDYSIPRFEQECVILQWFKDNFNTNPVKLKKLALRIRPKLPDYIQTSLCDEILMSADPVKWMRGNFNMIDDLRNSIESFVADGHHGMVYDKGDLYGIKLETKVKKWLTEKDGIWDIEFEEDIAASALKAWMIENNRIHHKDRVLLFERFGFSGVSTVIEYTLTAEEAKEAKRRADNRLLTRLLAE
ncbi:hypothetical protein D3C81_376490 [compost metagenome]